MLGNLNRVETHVHHGLTGAAAKGIDTVEDPEIRMSPVDLQNQPNDVSDLLLGSVLPLATAGETSQAEKGDPVLLGAVGDHVVELGVSGKLDVETIAELHMAVF